MPETLEAGTAGFSQRLLRTRCGDQIYIDEAYRLSERAGAHCPRGRRIHATPETNGPCHPGRDRVRGRRARPGYRGHITSLSGPVSSIGIPYDKGFKVWEAGGTEVAGQQLKLIEIDDASDPSAAARAAKKLIEEDHVDVIFGAASTPASMAVYGVSSEAKVPLIITANGL